jgi:hypothetical protein
MVEPQGPAEVTLGELVGIVREIVGSLQELITIEKLILDEVRGVNMRLDNFARGRGDGAPPV